jgi:hypothetical protein
MDLIGPSQQQPSSIFCFAGSEAESGDTPPRKLRTGRKS